MYNWSLIDKIATTRDGPASRITRPEVKVLNTESTLCVVDSCKLRGKKCS